MYCKYCAASLGENGARKCPNCGADINLLDGGQTFYEDADIQLWREKEPAEDSTPKTVIRPINNFAQPQNAPSRQTAETIYRGGMESIIKLAIVCVTALVALSLILAVVFISIDNGKKETTNNKNINTASKEIKYVKVHNLAYLCDAYIQQDKDESESGEQGDVSENNGSVSITIKAPASSDNLNISSYPEKDSTLMAIRPQSNSYPYVPFDDFKEEFQDYYDVVETPYKDGNEYFTEYAIKPKDDSMTTVKYKICFKDSDRSIFKFYLKSNPDGEYDDNEITSNILVAANEPKFHCINIDTLFNDLLLEYELTENNEDDDDKNLTWDFIITVK